MDKRKFEEPTLEVIRLEHCDVITTSQGTAFDYKGIYEGIWGEDPYE